MMNRYLEHSGSSPDALPSRRTSATVSLTQVGDSSLAPKCSSPKINSTYMVEELVFHLHFYVILDDSSVVGVDLEGSFENRS